MNELVKIPFGDAQRVGMELPEGLVEAEWKQVGHSLLRCKDSLNFWIGDWLNYGNAAYGEKYAIALEIFKAEGSAGYGLEEKTLRNYASVAARVKMSLRRDKLSFGHHAVVAYLEPKDQEHWLSMAVMNSWSVADLTREMRGKLKLKATGETNSTHGTFIFESWINEATRGFKSFPVSQWEDDVLVKRIAALAEIEHDLVSEAERRNLPIDRVKALEVVG